MCCCDDENDEVVVLLMVMKLHYEFMCRCVVDDETQMIMYLTWQKTSVKSKRLTIELNGQVVD